MLFPLRVNNGRHPRAQVDSKGFSVVRLNGLPLDLLPTVCRRVVCKIGGYAEVLSAVAAAGVDLLIGRTRAGVLAFGSDADVRAAFSAFEISEFDLHAVDGSTAFATIQANADCCVTPSREPWRVTAVWI